MDGRAGAGRGGHRLRGCATYGGRRHESDVAQSPARPPWRASPRLCGLRRRPPRTKLPPEQAKWASLGHATILTVTAVCVAALAAWILLRRRRHASVHGGAQAEGWEAVGAAGPRFCGHGGGR